MTTPSPAAAALRVHVVSHTHWDREWYHTAGRFRQRLVPLVDALLDALERGAEKPDAAPGTFLLDGQTIVVSDYLAVRPEQRERLVALLRQGVLEAGPWFVLADNLLPSGEAIVRNLEAGARNLRRLGVVAPPVAYCPDTFGHPAAMPTIAAGFGFDVAIVWRGLGGHSHPPADSLWWLAPDGARVLVHHLPPDGYEVGSALPATQDAATARWQSLAAHWRARSALGATLLPNGADHHARQPDRDRALEALSFAAQHHAATVIDSSLSAFARDLRAAANHVALPSVTGELRDSYGYTWTLQGTFGTRAAQKRRNARLERALLRDVEPWLALAWLHGGDHARTVSAAGALTLAQLPALLAHAWETVLRTHPHDTLCGCSSDAVALAMDAQQQDAASQLPGLRIASLALALHHDPVTARALPPLDSPPIVVRNRAARSRGGVAELRLLETIGDVRVGPGSAAAPKPHASVAADPPTVPDILLQRGRCLLRHDRRESPQHYPDDDLVREHRVLAWVPEVPAHGVRLLHTDASNGRGTGAVALPPAVTVTEDADGVLLENGIVALHCTRQGVTMRVGTRTLPHALTIDSGIDAGDAYTSSLRGTPTSLQLVGIAPGAAGPLRGSVRLRWALTADRDHATSAVPGDVESMTTNRVTRVRARGRWSGDVHVETELVLDAGAPYVRCDVRGTNRRRDHRLRLRWRTDVMNGDVWADAAFGPVRRAEIVSLSPHESAPRTMPMHRWAATVNPQRGATLISDGLAEVEVDGTELALTLVRAIGELSRADLPERQGHAGWPCATPHAQSYGPFRARLGFLLHDAWHDDTRVRIEDACDDLLLPLTGETWRDYRGDLRQLGGPVLEGAGLRASAVTLASAHSPHEAARADTHSNMSGDALILRAVNVTDGIVLGAWRLPDTGPWLVTPVRLDGTPDTNAGTPQHTDSVIPLRVGPRGVTTMRVTRVASAHHR